MDSFLCAHHIPLSKKAYYDISGIYSDSAISIRDQILRASLMVEKSIQKKLINAKTGAKARPLLIIGGGFSGVAAAVKAAQYNIPTFLVEREGTVLSRFLESTRYVSPSHYDFPHPHWTENQFPWNKSRIIPALSWIGEEILETASKFSQKLDEIQLNGYPLYIANRTDCVIDDHSATKKKDRLIKVEFQTNQTASIFNKFESALKGFPDGFGMVLSCLGVGQEIVKSEDYRSYHFWAFNAAQFRKRKSSTLIVGAGDGGLQDFLLLSTKLSTVKEIYEKVSKVFSSDTKYLVEREIYRTHDNRCREELWHGNDKRFRCHTYTRNHQSFVKLINEIFKKDTDKEIILALGEIVSDSFSKGLIKLAYSCKHFNRCYPLNHFLVLLLDKYYEIYAQKSLLLPNIKVIRISGKGGHICQNTPKLCAGSEHQVHYVKSTCRMNYRSETAFPFDPSLVLLRYGIDTKSKIDDVKKLYSDLPDIDVKISSMSGTKILPFTLP